MKLENFRKRVLEVVAAIPKGSVLSYGEVAKLAGNLRAARAVGAMMRVNHDPAIPCHRVIAASGALGGYNGGTENKIKRLQEEGVRIERRGKNVLIML